MSTSHRTAGQPAPCTWWSDRWAWRGTLAAAPFGALGAILYALFVVRASAQDALLAYALGAALAGGVGCLLAGPLGASLETARHRRRTRAEAAEPDHDEPAHEPLHAAPVRLDRTAGADEHARAA